MPAYSILAWLRRRRAVTRGVRRPTEAFRWAFSAFTGRYYSPRPPLLLPPLHWRELLRGVPLAGLEERAMFAGVDSDATPVVDTVEVHTPVRPRGAMREASRPDETRQIAQLRAERFVAALPPVIAREADDSVAETAEASETATSAETAASAVPTSSSEPAATREPVPPRARATLPPSNAASTASPERTPERSTSQPPPVAPDAAPSSTTPLGAPKSATSSTAPDVRSASEKRDAIDAVSPVEAVPSDRVSVSPNLAVPPTPSPATGVPAPRQATSRDDVRIQRDVPPPSPSAESPTRDAASPVHPRQTASDVPPAVARQDRVSPQAPPPRTTDAIEPKAESAIFPTEVSASVASASVTPASEPVAAPPSEPGIAPPSKAGVAPQSELSIAPPGEPGIAPRTADVARAPDVDDSLMTNVEERGTELPPRRALVTDPTASAEIPVAQPASTTKVDAISDGRPAVASLAHEAVSPEPARPPQRDVKQEATPIVEKRSAPPTKATSGIQPTEERRSRRSRPAASEHTQQRQATAPKSAQPGEASPPKDDAAAAEERSMVDWRRLLFEATSNPHQRNARASSAPERVPENVRPAPAPTKQPPAVADKPIETEPLLESTRRFLRPRVGIDPATVPVVRGPVADRLLRDAGADAAAVADAVVLPSSVDERSPRTLGLIAHELTHVAQRRQPRFVPPAVRSPSARPPIERGESSRARVPSSEEQLARHVERSVWNDAEQIAPEDRGISTDDVSSHAALDGEAAHIARPFAAPHAQNESNEWGGLPAPWEPLPTFASTVAEPTPAPVVAAPFAAEQTIHYAEHGRSLEGEQGAPTHGATPTEAAPPPDLDALARKVYEVLKRRLAAERRREG